VNALRLTELLHSVGSAALVFVGFFALFYVLERWLGGDPGRYRTRHFWNDVAYGLFYRGNFYQLLIGATVAGMLEPRLAFLRIGLLKDLPLPAAAVVFWITADFLGYWVHRLQHGIPFLWAFHSVHHAQERMTFLTSYRIHPIEQLVASLILFVPLLVIGLPPGTWLPLVAVLTALEFAQHADLPWRFGPLYRVLVSPVFHAIHHSTEARHHDRNFGKILSTWDVVFGTAVIHEDRPRRFGVEGLHMPESLGAQMVMPFRLVREFYGRPAASTPPPRPRLAGNATPGPLPAVSATLPSSDTVATLLKSAGTTLECEVRGQSMGDALPDGSRLRLRFEERPRPAVGDVVAFTAGAGVTVHRVVGRGLFGPARSFVLTRGDGSLLLDHPVHLRDVLGVVRECQNGGTWQRVPACGARGWRYAARQTVVWPVLLALHVQSRIATALTISGFVTQSIVRGALASVRRQPQ
jgi:sterol desaturase/sphingolipid hydroxylase (fatty acid hydroxylase superfamily)